MATTKDILGECQHCGRQFRFPAERAGLTGDCPHCGQPTELLLATPPEAESPGARKATVFIIVAVVILAGGLIGATLALKRAQRLVTKPAVAAPVTISQPSDPFTAQGFRVSPVTLERQAGSKLVYAQGTIVNTTNRQRFGVKVELDLFDAEGKRIASAADYVGVIEPNAEWKFRALVLEAKAASAKIAAIKETK